MAVETLVSLDDFLELPDAPGITRELLHGRLIEMPAPALLHAAIQAGIAWILRSITERSFSHFIVATHSGFLLNDESVQAPDVFLLDRERQRTMETYRGALRGAPDLAVEIISPSESAADVDEKVELYLQAGARTVWLVWPNTQHVLIHHAGGEVRKAAIGGFLDAPEVLPGVRIPVDSIFPRI
ncbi:MAG: Uma2 family endonuclease [Bryobacteraceae bacterium]|nr:Uma2 family endonuclease [Bryobacteraceae bacterium]